MNQPGAAQCLVVNPLVYHWHEDMTLDGVEVDADAVIATGSFTGLQGKEGASYSFADDRRHGSPDENWFTFTTVTNAGVDLVTPDMSKFVPAP